MRILVGFFLKPLDLQAEEELELNAKAMGAVIGKGGKGHRMSRGVIGMSLLFYPEKKKRKPAREYWCNQENMWAKHNWDGTI